jgi:hypothetical protein
MTGAVGGLAMKGSATFKASLREFFEASDEIFVIRMPLKRLQKKVLFDTYSSRCGGTAQLLPLDERRFLSTTSAT